ncbi:benzoyl-CoA reductase/2-hydroxyglutaryl-CoA dehydratase subunit, BcrC/BadD/HgdB [Candidatus Scalindua japonica]|uniref:Benzoyl-CoA reductase/2-hydroxyglutaryl-CoA dehydratase subunit, BcrC/BadD/HgdB n=1 Tax=Candidatus Scalindua japonica TaxID=1284222 RepID=A0A286U3W3_9BACT|nr:2-hydroxyacyl-CoA dehydratase [Candidatus Scalindua japonica]GAX62761.1 benzoyl-CoA reductase/2-hydroxyglutaryl-CoA dehydratase subunit, BcrC/BadD/HgdB [Candidatus Scalindua japonica]
MNSANLVNVGMSFPMSYRISVDKAIGITTTVPIEIVYAAGYVPIDLNNIFICNDDSDALVDFAEIKGLPRNTCAWIKGIYSATKKTGIKKIIGVVQGDCSNNHALIEILRNEGIDVIPFSYPHDRNRDLLYKQLDFLANSLGIDLDKAHQMKLVLDGVRKSVHEIDRLTWEENRVTGDENHIWNVSTSDLMGDYVLFEKKASDFLEEAEKRPAFDPEVRLGYIGVPPICCNLYSFLNELRVHVVFNEVQRQFSMPYQTKTLIDQYTSYTYPYDMRYHIDDIKKQVATRKIDGIIHYVQSFCHRQIFDRLIRQYIDTPVLTLDCDRPGRLSGSMRTRIEAFVEMLKNTKC